MSITTLSFTIYWFISQDKRVEDWFFEKYDEPDVWVNWLVFKRLTGAFLMGVVPAILALLFLPYTLSNYGINFQNVSLTFNWTIGITLFMLTANFFVSNRPINLSFYPQIRANNWNSKVVFLNCFSWISYLVAYEFLFRGILLLTCSKAFGFMPAVVINIAFYSLAHIPKGFVETIGAIPYGFLLCYVTATTGNLWFAFITHSVLALSTDFYSVHHNKEMCYT